MEKIIKLMDDSIQKLSKLRESIASNQILSPYNLAHNEIGNCCGVFDRINEEGMIYCNECDMLMHDAIIKNEFSSGLKDKNGKEICSGDRFEYISKKYKSKATVTFKDGMFCVMIIRKDQPDIYVPLIKFLKRGEVEVIGNIFKTTTP